MTDFRFLNLAGLSVWTPYAMIVAAWLKSPCLHFWLYALIADMHGRHFTSFRKPSAANRLFRRFGNVKMKTYRKVLLAFAYVWFSGLRER